MKHLKTFFSAFVLCCALAVLVPTMEASAAQTEIDSGKCGKNLTWSLTEDGTLTISGKGEMTDYGIYSDVPWYDHRASISKLVIEEGVTSITSYAFNDHDGLTALSLPDSMTIIGKHAFNGCNQLSGNVTFPANVTTIGDYAFSDCDQIDSITILGDATVGVRAFHCCDSLVELIVGSEVTVLAEHMYNNDSGMEKITVSKDNEYFCSRDGVLYDRELTRLIRCPRNYPNAACVIPDGVKTIGAHAFENCDILSTITIPNSVTTIEYGAFYSSRTSWLIYFLGTEEEWNAISFKNTESDLEYSTIIFCGGSEPSDITGICGEDLTWTLSHDGTFTISGTGDMYDYDAVSDTEWFAFRSSIQRVVAESGVTNIGESAFNWCKHLTSVTLSKTVTEIKRLAFDYCPRLESVTISGKLTAIGEYAFQNCQSLTSINLPYGITSVGHSAFNNCSALSAITIPESVTQLGDFVFYGCTSLTSVVIPSSIGTVSYCAFANCDALEKVTICDGITLIDGFAFYNCLSLREITIPGSVKTIDNHAFNYCDKLSTVVYGGTEQQWEQIDIDAENDYLEAATILATPTLTVANNTATGKIVIKWSAVTTAEKYEVWRSTSKNGTYKKIWTGTKTGLVHSSANPGETYYYKVRVVANGGVGLFSEAKGRTCDLARPVVKTANDAKTGKIVISWNAVSGAEKYELYRSASKNGTYEKIWSGKGTKVTNSSVNPGEIWYYKVRAIHSNSSANSAMSLPVDRLCDLARPVVKATNDAKTGKIIISWNAVPGAEKYELYRSASKNGTYKKFWSGTETEITNSGANPGEIWYYKVLAIHTNSDANSALSTPVGRACDCPRPSLSISLNSKGKPVLSWKAVSGAVKYELYRSTNAHSGFEKIWTGTGTKVTNSSTESGVRYYYKLRAIHSNSSANSAFSVIQTVVVK